MSDAIDKPAGTAPEAPQPKKKRRFTPLQKLSGWRRVSVGMWRPATHPTVLGEYKADVTRVLPLIETIRERYGAKLTPVHLWVKCVGNMFAQYPELNVIVRRNRFYARASADVFMQVAIFEGDGDLGGLLIRAVDQKTILEICQEISERAARIRARQDKELEKAKHAMKNVPPLLMPAAVRLTDMLSNGLGLDLGFLGVKSDAWGGAMVTNIGSLGLYQGFAPLVPATRTPLIFAMGKVHEVPVVEGGAVVPRTVVSVSATFDHRIFDGMQIAKLQNFVVDRFENPQWILDEIEARQSGRP